MLLVLAVAAFIGGHELLSHPLRAPLVARLGEKGFALLYSVVAFASLGAAVQLWRAIPKARLWDTPAGAYPAMLALMLLAFILFVGSVSSPNPAMMGGGGNKPRGMQRITRHPMMWSFALWGAVHVVLTADPRTIVLASGIAVLALFGAAMQDGKKKAQNPAYGTHMSVTSFMPFGAIVAGKQPVSALWPGAVPVLGGLALFAITLWAHPLLIGVPAIDWSYLQ